MVLQEKSGKVQAAAQPIHAEREGWRKTEGIIMKQ